MESNDSLPDLKLLQLDDVSIAENINKVLPVVQDCLKNSKEEVNILRGISIALGPCLNFFTIDEYEDKLFKYGCAAATDIYVKTLKCIENFEKEETYTQSDLSETFSNLLNVCLEVISYLQKVYRHLLDLGVIELVIIPSLPKCTSEILLHTYSHCKKSEEVYGTYLDAVSDVLTELFKNTRGLQQQFLRMLTEQGSVNCELANELNLLDDIMTNLYKAALSVTNLDVKIMADIWKGYMNLIEKYSEHLKVQHNVAEPISDLSENIVNNIKMAVTFQGNDAKEVVKLVKISFFALKIIIKLCEKFADYLGDCHMSLLKLLVILYKYNLPYLKYIGISSEIIQEITKQLTIGSEPLLSQLLNDNAMVNAFSKVIIDWKGIVNHTYGFLILCCALMKKLMHSKSETRYLWINSENNVIEWIFKIIPLCHYELFTNIAMPSVQVPGKSKCNIQVYEYVLAMCSGLVMTSTSKEFTEVEKILLKNTLQTNPWPAILAADVWCLMARFAESELVFSQLKVLVSMFKNFPTESTQPEKAYLQSLVLRLFRFMSQRHQQLFVELYPPKNNSALWSIFDLTGVLRTPSEFHFKSLALEEMSKLNAVNDRTLITYRNLESLLLNAARTITEGLDDQPYLEGILNLWKFDVKGVTCNPFLGRYIVALCSITSIIITKLTPQQINMILHQIKEILASCTAPCIYLASSEVMNELAPITFSRCNEEKLIIQKISTIFYYLLVVENPIVKESSFKIFSNFAYNTCHPETVTMSVNKNNELQSKVTNYLQKKLETKQVGSGFFQKNQVQHKHFCDPETTDECKKMTNEPLSKKPKLDLLTLNKEVNKIIQTLKEEANALCQCSEKMSLDQKIQIQSICDVLSNFLQKQ